jgi:hypothetical protein
VLATTAVEANSESIMQSVTDKDINACRGDNKALEVKSVCNIVDTQKYRWWFMAERLSNTKLIQYFGL